MSVYVPEYGHDDELKPLNIVADLHQTVETLQVSLGDYTDEFTQIEKHLEEKDHELQEALTKVVLWIHCNYCEITN